MPDFAMCHGDGCPVRKQCRRHASEPNRFGQSWSEFYANQPCQYFMPIPGETETVEVEEVEVTPEIQAAMDDVASTMKARRSKKGLGA